MRSLPFSAKAFAPLLLAAGLSMGGVSIASETEPRVTVNMRDAELSAFALWIAEQTQRQIVLAPNVNGTVTVLGGQPIPLSQAYQVFLDTLALHGYQAVEDRGILRIAPDRDAAKSSQQVIEQFDDLDGGGWVSHVIHLESAQASKLAETLKPLVSASGQVNPWAATNSLILSDSASNVKRLVKLARQLDVADMTPLEVIPLKHASAKEVASLVQNLTNSRGQKDSESLSVAPDNRSNALLLAGNESMRQRVRGLIRQLDRPLSGTGTTQVVYLNYLDAEEAVDSLRTISSNLIESAKSETATKESISVEAIPSSNALVITAPPPIQEELSQVIAKLDIKRPQVLIDALIIEVSDEYARALGVEWNSDLSLNNGVEAMTNFGLKSAAAENSVLSLVGDGLTLGWYRNGTLRALIRASANNSDINILSTPSILTLDNEEAEILVGSNVPFKTGQATGGASSSNNPFTTIERHDIGVKLKVTPQVNYKNEVTLDVVQEVETIADSLESASDLVTNKRSIDTKVLVADDRILVLGGLISDEETERVDKVPLLGSIPIAGALFRSTRVERVRKNLMVFLRPNVLDDSESRELTRNRYQQMKALQESGTAISNPLDEAFETVTPNR